MRRENNADGLAMLMTLGRSRLDKGAGLEAKTGKRPLMNDNYR